MSELRRLNDNLVWATKVDDEQKSLRSLVRKYAAALRLWKKAAVVCAIPGNASSMAKMIAAAEERVFTARECERRCQKG